MIETKVHRKNTRTITNSCVIGGPDTYLKF